MTATECIKPEYVILVDEHDRQIGLAEKMEAHQKNLLHRAFSVFIFRNQGEREILLQQRASHKYHSPLRWSNACCSHPHPHENLLIAGNRRLQEELGISANLQHSGCFKYNAHFANGLSEHEIDHVLVGHVSAEVSIQPNPEEVHAFRWVSIEALRHELSTQPDYFTPWLSPALEIALKGS